MNTHTCRVVVHFLALPQVGAVESHEIILPYRWLARPFIWWVTRNGLWIHSSRRVRYIAWHMIRGFEIESD